MITQEKHVFPKLWCGRRIFEPYPPWGRALKKKSVAKAKIFSLIFAQILMKFCRNFADILEKFNVKIF